MLRKLEKMCLQQDFDRSKAEDIIREIDVNQVFKSSDFDMDTTLLERAVDGANYEMVELLLKYGANPNLVHRKNFTKKMFCGICSIRQAMSRKIKSGYLSLSYF